MCLLVCFERRQSCASSFLLVELQPASYCPAVLEVPGEQSFAVSWAAAAAPPPPAAAAAAGAEHEDLFLQLAKGDPQREGSLQGQGAARGGSQMQDASMKVGWPSTACLSEEELAEQLALAVEWPIRYSLERLQPGTRTTALYVMPAEVDEATWQGAGPAGFQGVDVDVNGVPRSKVAGVRLAPWLMWGCLRGRDSALHAHALQPALRKHWTCPGCHTKIIGTFEDIRLHADGCAPALMLGQEALWSEDNYTKPSKAPPKQPDSAADPPTAAQPGAGPKLGPEAGDGDAGPAPEGQQGGVAQASKPQGTHTEGRVLEQKQTGAVAAAEAGLPPDAVLRLEEYLKTQVGWSRRLCAPSGARDLPDRLHHHFRQGADDCEQEEVLLPHSHANARRLHHHHRHHSSGSRGSSQPEQDDRGRGYSGGLQTHEDDDRWHMDGSSGVQGEGQGGVSGGAAGEPGAVKNVALGGGTASGRLRRFECPECGFVGEMTGVQVLRHKRMHAKH
mmetsp:Transcript_12511/g.33085  ORF Transcript_12511/g.33085 Transcript_12511/m.33085 type:complete len:503 (+) Transcript_12511:409-1917(+)